MDKSRLPKTVALTIAICVFECIMGFTGGVLSTVLNKWSSAIA